MPNLRRPQLKKHQMVAVKKGNDCWYSTYRRTWHSNRPLSFLPTQLLPHCLLRTDTWGLVISTTAGGILPLPICLHCFPGAITLRPHRSVVNLITLSVSSHFPHFTTVPSLTTLNSSTVQYPMPPQSMTYGPSLIGSCDKYATAGLHFCRVG
jgi:hypothetical protein